MSSRQLDEERIFHVARDLAKPETRAEYLEQVCAGDQALRDRVVALLQAHEQSQEFLKSGQPEPAPTVESTPLTERPGTVIGRYKLMEQIGEGGMGTVFVAEQERPIRRKVAIKVIKPGMDSKDVVARFEAERQALALMDHPNIAKVLDAGNTETGRPYFVMEFVRGISITDYCDVNNLNVSERLRLFAQVCQAVQHAHQKGIIHRDLKPSNVLVTLHDGEPVPKIIDFGVAKALNQRLTERTLYTRVHQAIGTLAYMSPEQAELSGLDVDTRTDVYGLGVLLYELLTGTTPFDAKRLNEAAFHEACRIIREEEPPRASTKVSSMGETATAVSAHRKTMPQDLARQLHGDLDWILLKSLEKDRTHRYESASAFAADVEHYMENEPVEARPPSTIYRVRKLIRRNRGLTVTVATIAIMLLAGTVALSGITFWALQQKHRAQRSAERNFALSADLLEAFKREAATAALAGDADAAREALRLIQNVSETECEYEKNLIEGLIAYNRGQYEEANTYASIASREVPGRQASQRIAARGLLALTLWQTGDSQGYDNELAQLRELNPDTDTDRLLMALALALFDPQRSAELLQASPRAEKSAIGLRIRGIVRALIGRDDRDARTLDAAIRDFDCSRLLNQEEGDAVGMQLLAIATAAELARSTDRHEDAAQYLRAGRSLAQMASPDNAVCNEGRWALFRSDGQTEKAAHAITQVGRFPGYGCMLLAVDCLERLDDPTALSEFSAAMAPEHQQSTAVQLTRVHLLPDATTCVEQRELLVAQLHDTESSFVGLFALYGLCRLVEPDEVRALAREFATRIEQVPYSDTTLFGNVACINVLAGGDEEQLIQKAGDSALKKSQAYFTIGMLRLVDGHRQQALENFKSAVETSAVGTYGYEWSRAYEARMERQSDWPRLPRDQRRGHQ